MTRNLTSWRPVIPLSVKDQIIELLSQGVNRKKIANMFQVSQTLITDQKQAMPLFSWHKETED